MMLLRCLSRRFIALAVIVDTIPVIHSRMDFLDSFPSFLKTILSMSWQGQFNTDFLAFLLLSVSAFGLVGETISLCKEW